MVQVRADVAPGPAAGALGKHEELPSRCTCGPEFLRLLSDQGELVRMRGGSVNRCEYCAQLAAVENCEMLVLDALEGDAPQLVAILGTRTATVDMDAFALGRQRVVEEVRKRWPLAQYAYEVEFTTGYGPRSGGKRRPHWNWFWKGIPRHDWTVASWVIVTTWCRYVDAKPAAQFVDLIRNEIGLTKYVTEHFMKASQRPPAGFSGQRFCCSRGYFGSGVSVRTARARARESLRSKRELWKALQAGHPAHDAELVAREALELAHRTVWVLANDRGARVGATGHNRRRMLLPSDREGVKDEQQVGCTPVPPARAAHGMGRPLAPAGGASSPPPPTGGRTAPVTVRGTEGPPRGRGRSPAAAAPPPLADP